jgi:hypothetical protein
VRATYFDQTAMPMPNAIIASGMSMKKAKSSRGIVRMAESFRACGRHAAGSRDQGAARRPDTAPSIVGFLADVERSCYETVTCAEGPHAGAPEGLVSISFLPPRREAATGIARSAVLA